MTTFGSLAGLALAAIRLVRGDSIIRAAIEGLFVGAFVAIALALLGPGRTPVATSVSMEDEPLVIEAVREGRTVTDLRLAEPVLRHSRDVQARLDQDRFFLWVAPLFAVLTFSFAVLASAFGTGAGVIIAWTVCASWIALTIWIPLRSSAAMKRAERAEEGALTVLAYDFARRADL